MMQCEQFTDFIHAHITETDSHSVLIDKLFTRQAAESAGLKCPEVLFQVPTIRDVDFENLPETLVLKLTNQASKRGVFILHKFAGGFYEQLRKKVFAKSDIINHIESLDKVDEADVLGEALVLGENGAFDIPFDYKLYTFDSGVEFILQVNRNGDKDAVAFFDGNFEPIDDDRVRRGPKKYIKKGRHVRPANYRDMLDAAKQVHRVTKRPFISVDLYTTGNDIFVGELTPTPGGPYVGNLFRFSEQFDTYLGSLMQAGYRTRGWAIPTIDSLSPVRQKRN